MFDYALPWSPFHLNFLILKNVKNIYKVLWYSSMLFNMITVLLTKPEFYHFSSASKAKFYESFNLHHQKLI